MFLRPTHEIGSNAAALTPFFRLALLTRIAKCTSTVRSREAPAVMRPPSVQQPQAVRHAARAPERPARCPTHPERRPSEDQSLSPGADARRAAPRLVAGSRNAGARASARHPRSVASEASRAAQAPAHTWQRQLSPGAHHPSQQQHELATHSIRSPLNRPRTITSATSHVNRSQRGPPSSAPHFTCEPSANRRPPSRRLTLHM
jgi:hypothetical protein